MNRGADFSDLKTRVISAVTLAIIGLVCLWIGGEVFGLLIIICAGLMGWEISRMYSDNDLLPMAYGMLLAGSCLAAMYLSWPWFGALAALTAGATVFGHAKNPVIVFVAALGVGIGCVGLHELRLNSEFDWTLWVILVVIASDVGGYFAGKLIGGPKLWTRISPKKTWSGTIGGWILAALVGWVASLVLNGHWTMILFSILMAIAAQAGDLLESALKRRAGVKDSSALIPGHGGLLDRFDGLLGAAGLVGILMYLDTVGLY